MSGRAGRTGKPATVYFQTYNLNTENDIDITNKNPDIFLDKEIELRKKNNLPPFQRFIALIIITGKMKENFGKLMKHLKLKILLKVILKFLDQLMHQFLN